MSTRSVIAKKTTEGYDAIYCHWDGYPSHHLPILTKHYNSDEKVDRLLENGSLSSLDEKCDKPEGHGFDNPIKGYCVYYGRDRGEKEVVKIPFEKKVIEKAYKEYFTDLLSMSNEVKESIEWDMYKAALNGEVYAVKGYISDLNKNAYNKRTKQSFNDMIINLIIRILKCLRS